MVQQKEMDESRSLLLQEGLEMKADVGTQTNPGDVPISNQIILEQDDDYADDFDQGRSASRVMSEIHADASSNNISRTEIKDISARV